MDKKTVFVKTSKGEYEVKGKGGSLYGDLKRALFLVDETSTFDEISKRSAPSLRTVLPKIFEELIAGGYIRDETKPFAEQQITVPKAVKQEAEDELDFTSLPRAPAQNKSNINSVLEAQAKAKQEAEEARALALAEAKRAAEIEAIAKQEALLKAQAETKAKIEAEARMRAEQEAAQAKLQLEAAAKVKEAAAKAKAEAEVKARQEAEAARIKAEETLRIKIEQEVEKVKAEAKLKAEAEGRAHALAEENARKAAEAARLKADLEAAKIKVELEAAKAKAEAEARARALFEEKAKKAAEEARQKADQAAAKIKAELDAAKATAEAQAKALAEERVKQEAARLKTEQEAARMKAELEAAKAKAETQAKALAEERAKQEAERLKADQEASKIRAEMEAAKTKAEATAKAKALAEEAARKEAEIARLKAEQEAVKIQAELEAAKTKADAEVKAKALAEEAARQEAEMAKIKAQEVAAKIKAEMETARVRAEEEAKSIALADAKAKQEAARLQAEMEAKVKAEVEARARALAEERTRQESARMKAEAEAKALADARAKQELEAANLRSLQGVERIKVDAENLANSFHEPASFEHEVAFKRKIDDSRLEAERAALERKIAEQEIALKKQNEEAQKLADEQAKAWAAAEQRANELARAEASRPMHMTHVIDNVQPVAKARKYRKPIPVGKILASLLVVVVLLILLLPYVMPLNDYIAPIEKQLTAQFKQPVHVSALRAETLPWPKLQLEKVTIGSAQEITVGKALLTFNPFSLFSSVKNIRSLELQDVSVDAVSLEKESVWMQEIGSDAGYQVAHVTVHRIKILNSEIDLPLFDGDIEITGQGRFGKVTLRSADEKFVVNLQSDQNKWQFTFNSKGTLPLFPNVLLDDFTANGDISEPSANFSTIDAQAYGGFLHGSAKLTWQKGWQLQGRIGAKSIELVKLLPKYSVSGELQGDYNFSLNGNKLAQIAEVKQVDGSFTASKVVINNMDMVETVRQGNRQTGRTHIDELSGNVQVNSRGQHFQQLQISSGILSGSGSFDVSPSSQLSGHLSVALKTREGGTSALTLSGNLTEPILNTGR